MRSIQASSYSTTGPIRTSWPCLIAWELPRSQRHEFQRPVRTDWAGVQRHLAEQPVRPAAESLRPSFYRMIRDILRFNRDSLELLDESGPGPSLGTYLEQNRYSQPFIRNYIVPMGGAIWSAGHATMWEFPARYLVQFFKNHGMLSVDARPTWRVITGGSQRYVEQLVRPFRDRIRLQSPVELISRYPDRVEVRGRDRARAYQTERFDGVVLACHSDQALALLADPSPWRRRFLAQFVINRTRQSCICIYRPLPRRRLAWAAWNYYLLPTQPDHALVTYHMNQLQGLAAPCEFCVTLNHTGAMDPATILKRMTYHHPLYTPQRFPPSSGMGISMGVPVPITAGPIGGSGFTKMRQERHGGLPPAKQGEGHEELRLRRTVTHRRRRRSIMRSSIRSS